jgi:hypothetical protein
MTRNTLGGNMNIKKFIICLLTLGIVSCSACAKKEQLPVELPPVAVPQPTPTVTPVVVVPKAVPTKVGKAEFVLPSDAWQPVETEEPNTFGFKNEEAPNLIYYGVEDFPGTFEQYILFTIRSIREVGANVHAAKQVTVNGNRFVLVESSKNGVYVMTWLTWTPGFGHSFSCASPTELSNRKELCNSVGNTFKLN